MRSSGSRRLLAKARSTTTTFRPFIVDNNYVFRTDNTRALFSRIHAGLTFTPAEIDWYDYWLNVHIPGLQKWVFPRCDEAETAKPRRVYTYKNLIELFDACTKNHGGRLAMRIERDGREERYTYGDFRECALRAAAFLKGKGVAAGERIALLSDNSPEWGMAYFGVVRTGAAVIPLEKEVGTEEIVRLLGLGEAKAIIISDELLAKHAGLRDALDDAVAIWTLDEVFALTAEATEQKRIAELTETAKTVSPGTTASIIFTSGTTGKPQGRDAHPQELRKPCRQASLGLRHHPRRRHAERFAAPPFVRVHHRVSPAAESGRADYLSHRSQRRQRQP